MNKDGFFYKKFKQKNSYFSTDTFQCAEATVSELLNKETTSDHPGMLLGKVQSGKTRTFISTLILAFDNDYDIAIVLSKNSKALIQQTYKRLYKDFEDFIESQDIEIYDIMSSPKEFSRFELESKLIFISKKQDDNLKRLIELFRNPLMRDKKVLIVDDEADSASIGYSKHEDVISANKIATQISKLRSLITKVSFLQVTATPYSLYLQPPEIDLEQILEFKPMRPAFTKLVPVPKEYVGGDTYFGELSKSSDDTLESLIHFRIDHSEFNCLKKQDKRVFSLENVLKTSKINGFRTALVNFIVGGCIQRINGGKARKNLRELRYSFLLHSQAEKSSHNWQYDLTQAIIESLKSEAENVIKINPKSLFLELIENSYNNLVLSLTLDNKPIPSLEEVFNEVREALLGEYVTITKVNSEENVIDMLDSTGQLKLRSPLHIFIGGQVLDRGVTLANLIGFYYGRRPNKFQQDTVLQHSRMYGYRRDNLAVTRFYTSQSIRATMEQMEEFDSSLRAAIESGGDKSVQFIQRSRDGKIIPCSPNKILVSSTQTLRPNKRILPIGFKTRPTTGRNGISKTIQILDKEIEELVNFNTKEPKLISLEKVLPLLDKIKETIYFDEREDVNPFDWDAARAALIHLSNQHPVEAQKGYVLLWAAKERNSARLSGEYSHSTYIETPDSPKTEGKIAKDHAHDYPIVFLLRQEGKKDNGWSGSPFYWPVIRAQTNARTAIFVNETIK